MTHLLRGKQAGIQADLSVGLSSELFKVDDINRYGINSQTSVIAYDPVQGLIAVGTNDTRFGPGQIYIFGAKRISVVLNLQRKASVKILQFCADKIICLDSRNDLSVFSLETKTLTCSYSPPGTVTAVCSDPTLDYVLLGIQSGEVLAYDLDREGMAPFKLPGFWGEQNPRARHTPVVALALHPRDIGTLLIGYAMGAVLYSFKHNKPLKYFAYEVPRGAPGGDSDPTHATVIRHPQLTHALWHPTGTFILTAYSDSSLVFWDPSDGRLVLARTLEDTNVNIPGSVRYNSAQEIVTKDAYSRIAWCANQDPDDTAILISGGMPSDSPTKGLTMFELGRTPNYTTSSWDVLAQHLASPKKQRILPTPPGATVVDFCLIPRTDPHFNGANDPIAVISTLSSGEIVSMSFPSGYPISPTNQLHISMTFVAPFITSIQLSPVERSKWLGLTEKRSHGPKFVEGGAEANRPFKRYESRNIVQTAHADGSVRLWDAGHGDEIENDALIQVDVGPAIGRTGGAEITKMSFSGASGEFAAGTRTGEVAVFRWAHNRNAGREPPEPKANNPGGLTDIQDRVEASLSDGFLPFTLLDAQNGPCTALKISDVGFIAAGFEGGDLHVIDMRGPAVIFRGAVSDFTGQSKAGSFKKGTQAAGSGNDWPTYLEFSIMDCEADAFSSLMLHVGTNRGHLATFRIIPEQSGRHGVHYAGLQNLEDKVIRVTPINAITGAPAYASQDAFSNLRNNYRVNGVLIAVTSSGVRIFKPATHKGAQKGWDNYACMSAQVSRCGDGGYALVGVFADGSAKAYSLPALKEIATAKVGGILDRNRLDDTVVTETGDVFGWAGPSETAMLNVWGTGITINRSKDILFNPELLIPPRPTISNFQWVSGTQFVTPSDLDLLIGGPDRPPSKRMLAQSRADGVAARQAARDGKGQVQDDQGYWAYMQNQLNERTKNLNVMGDSVNRLEESSANWAEQASKWASQQKRNMLFGAVKGKFL